MKRIKNYSWNCGLVVEYYICKGYFLRKRKNILKLSNWNEKE